MKDVLESIKEFGSLAIPKEAHSLHNVESVFGPILGETDRAWLVRCSHTYYAPATESEIQETEKELGFPIPSEYKEFLKITNGARLFCVPRRWLHDTFPNAMHVRFDVFGCARLAKAYKSLFKVFREVYADDPEYRSCAHLNYMAFCDAEDGNFQALLLDEKQNKQVFMLFHELFYRPYSEADADLYYKISDSLESWLKLIYETGGWGGRGVLTSGL
jgi:SMI1 / KNR4 family (SUKH-1)